LLVATHGIVDSLHLKDLAKCTSRGLEQQVLEGFTRAGGFSTIGMCRSKTQTSAMPTGRTAIQGVGLEVEPAQAETVRRIFERYGAGHLMKRIAIDMNNEGTLSPQPQKGRVSQSWCQSSIHHILHNERYRGVVI
jgi:hypothetical protein